MVHSNDIDANTVDLGLDGSMLVIGFVMVVLDGRLCIRSLFRVVANAEVRWGM